MGDKTRQSFNGGHHLLKEWRWLTVPCGPPSTHVFRKGRELGKSTGTHQWFPGLTPWRSALCYAATDLSSVCWEISPGREECATPSAFQYWERNSNLGPKVRDQQGRPVAKYVQVRSERGLGVVVNRTLHPQPWSGSLGEDSIIWHLLISHNRPASARPGPSVS